MSPQELQRAYDHLGTVERRIVDSFIERLGAGQVVYGKFKPVDPRDLAQETWEEVADALVYASKKLKELQDARDTEPCPAEST